jgi:hypothetical protein
MGDLLTIILINPTQPPNPMSQEREKREKEKEKECYWFDLSNWRFSKNPDNEDYLPNQWWTLICDDQNSSSNSQPQ